MDHPITISEGTLRVQDLLPAFLDALRDVAPAHYEQLLVLPFSYVPAHAMEDDDDPWWGLEEAYDKLAEITDLLDEHAPEGTYFGAHEGDGACFGFWSIEEEDAAWKFEELTDPALGKYTSAHYAQLLVPPSFDDEEDAA